MSSLSHELEPQILQGPVTDSVPLLLEGLWAGTMERPLVVFLEVLLFTPVCLAVSFSIFSTRSCIVYTVLFKVYYHMFTLL